VERLGVQPGGDGGDGLRPELRLGLGLGLGVGVGVGLG